MSRMWYRLTWLLLLVLDVHPSSAINATSGWGQSSAATTLGIGLCRLPGAVTAFQPGIKDPQSQYLLREPASLLIGMVFVQDAAQSSVGLPMLRTQSLSQTISAASVMRFGRHRDPW